MKDIKFKLQLEQLGKKWSSKVYRYLAKKFRVWETAFFIIYVFFNLLSTLKYFSFIVIAFFNNDENKSVNFIYKIGRYMLFHFFLTRQYYHLFNLMLKLLCLHLLYTFIVILWLLGLITLLRYQFSALIELYQRSRWTIFSVISYLI